MSKKNMRIFSCFLFCLGVFLCKPAQAEEGFDILIVAGQSNAEGCGLGFAFDHESMEQDHKILQLGRFGDQNGLLLEATDILQHRYFYPEKELIGFGRMLARRLKNRCLGKDRKVLIVPVAQGGTSILEWLGMIEKNREPGLESATLYPDFLRRAQLARKLAGPGSRVIGIVWHQGESDIEIAALGLDPARKSAAKDLNGRLLYPLMPDAATYIARLRELRARMWRDLQLSPQLPFLMGAPVPLWLQKNPALPIKESFVEALIAYQENNPGTGFVSAKGLLSNREEVSYSDDEIHFSASSMVQLADRYFEAFQASSGNSYCESAFSSRDFSASPAQKNRAQ